MFNETQVVNMILACSLPFVILAILAIHGRKKDIEFYTKTTDELHKKLNEARRKMGD